MKIFLTVLLNSVFCFLLLAQAPQAFNYQGVARNLQGEPLINQTINIKIEILKESVNGEEVYEESHMLATNGLGLFTISVGEGQVITGDFASIDWGASSHFLQLLIDENGGSNFQLVGTSQLLSVPYALFAQNGTKWREADKNIYYEAGFVGIGFDSPFRPLHLRGESSVIQVDRNRSSPAIQLARFDTDLPFEDENYLLGFGMGVDLSGSQSGGYLYFGEDVNKDFATGNGDGGIRMVIQKGGNVGIGTINPGAKLQVTNGDVYIENINRGVIMKSPNGQCWRYQPDNSGQLTATAIACPN